MATTRIRQSIIKPSYHVTKRINTSRWVDGAFTSVGERNTNGIKENKKKDIMEERLQK